MARAQVRGLAVLGIAAAKAEPHAERHDPTQLNRQGWDVGDQYRSAIFFHDAEQETLATASRDRRQAGSSKEIVTQVVAAVPFYDAEDYHQRYFEKHGGAVCATTLR
ncbi:MAG: peptide-methionine (S)-S-oxide reductase [Chloroflexi bacterium]|nr:MAG: peptide-methionine (S)-S-oxide reductase [Chloroflexota bacterium]